MAKPKKDIKPLGKHERVKLNMTFEEAIRLAVNTPIPSKKGKKQPGGK